MSGRKISWPRLSIQLRQERSTPLPKVSFLFNRIHYHLQNAFIIKQGKKFRLIVYNQIIRTDVTYKNARGARIAFMKFWQYRQVQDNTKPQWSHFYTPDKQWCDFWLDFIVGKEGISLLINAPMFNLERALIVVGKEEYRLIVIHQDQPLTDEIFSKLQDAQDNFLHWYKERCPDKNQNPQWSNVYPPALTWLQNSLAPLRKDRC